MVHAQRDRGGGSLNSWFDAERQRTTLVVKVALAGLLAALAACWVLAPARYGGPDEPAHVLRAYAVAHGEWRGSTVEGTGLAPGYRIVHVPRSLASGDPACFRHDSTALPDCAATSTSSDVIRAGTSAGVNPPLYYALVGAVARMTGGETDPMTYRWAAAALNVLVVLAAVQRARPLWRRHGGGSWVLLAALTPAAWFLVGVVNPNGAEIALSLLAWVGVARCIDTVRSPTERATASLIDMVSIAAPMAAAIAMRPIAVVTAVTMCAVVESIRRLTAVMRAVLWLPLACAVVMVLAWYASIGSDQGVLDDPRTAQQASIAHAVTRAISDLPHIAQQLIGSLGWLEYSAGPLVQVCWLAALTLALTPLVRGRRRVEYRRAVVAPVLVWTIALVATPVAFDVALFGAVGPIWQGRYSLPLWLGIGAFLVAKQSLPMVGAALAACVLTEVGTYWTVLRRSTVGTDGSWWFRGAVTTNAPRHPLALLALNLAIVSALAALAMVGAIRHSRTHR